MSYIVIDDTLGTAALLLRRDNVLWKNVPKLGILLSDEHVATEFDNRADANRAITRTQAYMARIQNRRQLNEYRVFRLQPEAAQHSAVRATGLPRQIQRIAGRPQRTGTHTPAPLPSLRQPRRRIGTEGSHPR